MLADVEKRADEAEQTAADAQKRADEALAEAEKRAKDLEKEVRDAEKRATDAATKAAEVVQKQVDRQGEQQVKDKEAAKAETAAPQPIIVVVPGGEGGEREIEISLQSDAQGRLTGAKGTSKTRAKKADGDKPAAKKPAAKK
jgi:hypothetical protein